MSSHPSGARKGGDRPGTCCDLCVPSPLGDTPGAHLKLSRSSSVGDPSTPPAPSRDPLGPPRAHPNSPQPPGTTARCGARPLTPPSPQVPQQPPGTPRGAQDRGDSPGSGTPGARRPSATSAREGTHAQAAGRGHRGKRGPARRGTAVTGPGLRWWPTRHRARDPTHSPGAAEAAGAPPPPRCITVGATRGGGGGGGGGGGRPGAVVQPPPRHSPPPPPPRAGPAGPRRLGPVSAGAERAGRRVSVRACRTLPADVRRVLARGRAGGGGELSLRTCSAAASRAAPAARWRRSPARPRRGRSPPGPWTCLLPSATAAAATAEETFIIHSARSARRAPRAGAAAAIAAPVRGAGWDL